jgi:hypothetical protein
MPKTRKPNAQWDANAAKIFSEICVNKSWQITDHKVV